jgi:hypothetical protein
LQQLKIVFWRSAQIDALRRLWALKKPGLFSKSCRKGRIDLIGFSNGAVFPLPQSC